MNGSRTGKGPILPGGFVRVLGIFVLLLSLVGGMTVTGCVTQGTAPAPVVVATEDFLAKHEALIHLGVTIAVMHGVQANPQYKDTALRLSDSVEHMTLPAVSFDGLKAAVIAHIDWTKFTPLDRIFAETLLDEAFVLVKEARNSECAKHPTSVFCAVGGDWSGKAQVYAKKFAGYLKEGVLAAQMNTPR